ncbi:MAG: alpha-glucosidase, family 31 of glycosyl hydrolase [Firmicutes bacterium]|nr:alpha-glucosidase, family 31 of glycosyl hydrolase [Bacillota bacterium]
MLKSVKSRRIMTTTLAVAFALTIGGSVFAAEAAGKVRYEAEAGKIKGTDTKIVAHAAASAGKKVGWINIPDKDSVTFTVNVPTAGDYIIEVTYDAGAGDAKQTMLVNGKEKFTVRLPRTGSWEEIDVAEGVKVHLKAGANTVALIAASSFAEIDCIDISPATAE